MASQRKTRSAKRAAATAGSFETDIHVDEPSVPDTPTPTSHQSNTAAGGSATLGLDATRPAATTPSTDTQVGFRQPFSEVSANTLEQQQNTARGQAQIEERAQAAAEAHAENSTQKDRPNMITLTVQARPTNSENDENTVPTTPSPKKGKGAKAGGKKKGGTAKKSKNGTVNKKAAAFANMNQDLALPPSPVFNLVIAKDEHDMIPGSPASDKAAELLRSDAGNTSDAVVFDESGPSESVAPSPAVGEVRNLNAAFASSPPLDAETLSPVDFKKSSMFAKEASKTTTSAGPSGTDAAFKLQSLFTPIEDNNTGNTLKLDSLKVTSPPASGSVTPREDPFDALEHLEDAIEQAGKAMGKLHQTPESTNATYSSQSRSTSAETADSSARKATVRSEKAKAATRALEKKILTLSSKSSAAKTAKEMPRAATMTTKTAAARQSINSAVKAASVKKPMPKPTTATKAGEPKSFAEMAISAKEDAVDNQEKMARKRRSTISALQTPPPVAKSSKPLTKASFQLPGESITAKRRAQLEERLRKQEEDERKRREFKARPVSMKKIVPLMEVKPTAATLARMKATIGDVGVMDSAKASSPTSSTFAGASTVSSQTVKHIKRLSTFEGGAGDQRRSSTLAIRMKPAGVDSSGLDSVAPKAAVAREVKATASIRKARPSSMFVGPTGAATASGTVASKQTKARPLSIQSHPTLAAKAAPAKAGGSTMGKQPEKTVKDKAEAAKKARDEAAERGRQASREWAEKRKQLALLKSGKAKSGAASTATGKQPLLHADIASPVNSSESVIEIAVEAGEGAVPSTRAFTV